MTPAVVSTHPATDRRYPFTGRARWLAAALVVTGSGLQVVEFLLENPRSDNTARISYWAANPTRVNVANAIGLLAVPFLLGGFAVMVTLCHRASRRLSWAAAALLACAMVGLAAVHGAELMAQGLVRAGNHPAALTALDGNDLGAGGVTLVVLFLGGALFGVLTLVAAMWRSPLLPRLAPMLMLGFAVLDFVVGSPVISHVVGLAAGVAVAFAVVTGYDRSRPQTLRIPSPRAGEVTEVSRSATEQPTA